MTKKIYLAASFTLRVTMRLYRDQLEREGFESTARWVDANGGALPSETTVVQRAGAQCYEDVARSDTVVIFTHIPSSTGGYQVELGLALAWGKRIIVVGGRPNIFYHLHYVENVGRWSEALKLMRETS